MELFDLAAVVIGKARDLAARLIFERLAESLIPNLDLNALSGKAQLSCPISRRTSWIAREIHTLRY